MKNVEEAVASIAFPFAKRKGNALAAPHTTNVKGDDFDLDDEDDPLEDTVRCESPYDESLIELPPLFAEIWRCV